MMLAEKFVRLVVRIAELRRDCQMLLADDELSLRFRALLQDEESELVFREFRIPPRMPG